MDLADALRIIIDNAKAAREAGVSSVRVEGVEFTLREADPPPADDKKQPEERRLSTLDDPTTWGLPEGAQVPGFSDPRKANR